mgnify:CR=1 FL=1
MAKNITIIGAGIVGIATASYLRRDGHNVTVVDERPPGEYCSFGNAGILSPGSCVPQALPGVMFKVPGYLKDPLGPLAIRKEYFATALPWFMRLVLASRRSRVEQIADALRPLLKQTFDAYAPLVANAGIPDMIRKTGYAVAYGRRASYERDSLAWQLRRERGVAVEEISPVELKQKLPQLAGDYEIGLYLPEQGYVLNPERLTKALAEQFQRDGGKLIQRKVLDIEVSPDGPRALVTNQGNLAVETLVVCAGAHSHEFTAKFGDRLPLEAERGYHVTYSDPRFQMAMPVFLPEHKVFITPMEMGLRIAGQSEFAGVNAEPNYGRADVLKRQMQKFFPGISEGDATQWMGRRPSMPDSLPVIGSATQVPNVWYAFGHGHVGLCGGASTGRLIAEMIAGKPTNIDATPFRAGRF